MSIKRFCLFALAAAGIASLVYLLWELADILLLAFGAILLAMLLNLVAEPLRRWTPLPKAICLALAGLIVVGVIGAAGWIFGSQLSSEFSDVYARVTDALQQIRTYLQRGATGRFLLSQMQGSSFSITSILSRMFSISVSFIAGVVVMCMSAAYLASQPALYRRGVIFLFPPRRHDVVGDTLDAIGGALRLWLLGQFIEMAIIGAMSTLAAYLIGLHSALALGVIATVTEFVPYVGPVVAGVPAVLVGLTQGQGAALWTIVAYILIHQIEGNLIQPLIQRQLVYVPPAAMLLGIAAVGAAFGVVGLIFAAPLVVAIFVAVQKLYVRDTLKEPTAIAGQPEERLDAPTSNAKTRT